MSNDAMSEDERPEEGVSKDTAALSRSEMVDQRLRALKLPLNDQIAYQLESVFPKLDGWGARGEIKRRHQLIRLVEPTLVKMLLDGEEVLYVAKGVQYSLTENYLFGAFAALMNQMVLVLTNARLLMMRSNGSGKPAEMFWVIFYSEITDFKTELDRWSELETARSTKTEIHGVP